MTANSRAFSSYSRRDLERRLISTLRELELQVQSNGPIQESWLRMREVAELINECPDYPGKSNHLQLFDYFNVPFEITPQPFLPFQE